ncbi:MAG: leucine-rich repeat domain-containing protein, partial [Clostridia bacterium]|nr:leucine-rich repeat domain-containing protein [Clostridia bacterium]
YLYLAVTTSTDITSANIDSNCKFIGSHAFWYCSSLTSVVIGDSVTSIGYSAFRNCSSLTSVVIPDSVTSIGGYTFSSCSSLTSINYCGTKEQWNAISKANSWDSSTGEYTIVYNYTSE